ncbi:MAG: tRNA (N(6)-L-threonylcarbamoyladenosine(37)-C(2))-methylthiotransferase MtaB [Bacteroidales bacterium]|nr:tRNA (N(6)-L-threonylcarbamoyladenosine(37)-C(2))-methylthiotransferase MtaB [Bacteroidales bacterium]
MKTKTFFIHTLGCKLNFAESSQIADDLQKIGYAQCQKMEESDLIIIHSCAVTASAEKKTRNLISKAKNSNPKAKIALMGCFVDVSKDIEKYAELNQVLPNDLKMDLASILSGEFQEHRELKFHPAYSRNMRTRSFLKIQDGCDHFCTYCTVAHARGRSRSDSIEAVLKNIQKIIDSGFKEIIFTGVNIGTFGIQNNESFTELITAVDQKFTGSGIRIRTGSIEPELLSEEIINITSKSEVIMPHFHLPLQSGCDEVLERMKRRYNTALYTEKCSLIKEKIPQAAIAADLIVGFPGETDDEFQETYDFLNSIPISYIHAFTYSDRPLAKASSFPEKVSPQTTKERMNQIVELTKAKELEFYKENLGSTRKILTESRSKDGFIFGFSDNYIKCAVDENLVGRNEVFDGRLHHIEADFVVIA